MLTAQLGHVRQKLYEKQIGIQNRPELFRIIQLLVFRIDQILEI